MNHTDGGEDNSLTGLDSAEEKWIIENSGHSDPQHLNTIAAESTNPDSAMHESSSSTILTNDTTLSAVGHESEPSSDRHICHLEKSSLSHETKEGDNGKMPSSAKYEEVIDKTPSSALSLCDADSMHNMLSTISLNDIVDRNQSTDAFTCPSELVPSTNNNEASTTQENSGEGLVLRVREGVGSDKSAYVASVLATDIAPAVQNYICDIRTPVLGDHCNNEDEDLANSESEIAGEPVKVYEKAESSEILNEFPLSEMRDLNHKVHCKENIKSVGIDMDAARISEQLETASTNELNTAEQTDAFVPLSDGHGTSAKEDANMINKATGSSNCPDSLQGRMETMAEIMNCDERLKFGTAVDISTVPNDLGLDRPDSAADVLVSNSDQLKSPLDYVINTHHDTGLLKYDDISHDAPSISSPLDRLPIEGSDRHVENPKVIDVEIESATKIECAAKDRLGDPPTGAEATVSESDECHDDDFRDFETSSLGSDKNLDVVQSDDSPLDHSDAYLENENFENTLSNIVHGKELNENRFYAPGTIGDVPNDNREISDGGSKADHIPGVNELARSHDNGCQKGVEVMQQVVDLHRSDEVLAVNEEVSNVSNIYDTDDAEEDFGDFGDFETTKLANVSVGDEICMLPNCDALEDDEFGDFGDFETPETIEVCTAPVNEEEMTTASTLPLSEQSADEIARLFRSTFSHFCEPTTKDVEMSADALHEYKPVSVLRVFTAMESCKENLSDGLFWSDKSLASCMEKTKSFRSCAPKLVVVDTFQKENFDCEATDLSWIEAMLSTQDCVQGDLQKTAALGSDVTKDSDKKPSSNSGVTIREGTDTFFKEIPDLSFMLESTLSIPPGVDANHIFNLESPI